MSYITLTKKQEAHIKSLVKCFIDKCAERGSMHPMFLFQMQVIYGAFEGNEQLDQREIDAIVYLLDLYFAEFDDDDIDPLAEQSYTKLYGTNPFDTPFYDRIKGNEYLVSSSTRKQHRPLGS